MAESATPPPGRIFISYRREETAYPAGWLYDRLVERYGGGQVFKDVDSIQLGDDFVEMINRAVGSCDVLLALIGDRWLTITDDNGRRRLDDPKDFVRVEIEAALTRNVRVIPILVDGARMPQAADLPGSLAKLERRQALELSPARFDFDTSRLLRVLDTTLADVRTAHADAASTKGPAGKAPDPSTTERKPPGKQRRRLSTRAWVLAGAGVGVALILLIVAGVVNSNTGSSESPGKGVAVPPVGTNPDTPPTDDGGGDPDACIQGYVWREAVSGDHVCVTPETHDQAVNDNELADSRRSPTGGDFGPDTCIQGYVWREAVSDDHVCVTPETRAQAAEDNSLADSRRVG